MAKAACSRARLSKADRAWSLSTCARPVTFIMVLSSLALPQTFHCYMSPPATASLQELAMATACHLLQAAYTTYLCVRPASLVTPL